MKTHINVNKHLWNKVLNKVTEAGIKNLINQAIRKGVWKLKNNGVVEITWKYKGRIITVTGRVINRIFNISDAWVNK